MVDAVIVALGRWGRRLVDSVQENGNPKGSKLRFTRAVVRTPTPSADYATSQDLKLGTSFEAALADRSVQAVVLATPHDLHPAQIAAAAQAGKHVFVEKPIAFRLADAEAAVRSVRERKLVLGVGYNRRYLPAIVHLKRRIADRSLGELVHLEGNFSNNSGLKYHSGMWRAEEKGPRAALTAMGVHIMDTFICLCGPIRAVRTMSVHRTMPVAVDDAVSVDVHFRNGASGVLSTLLVTPRNFRVQVFGTAGWAHLRDEHLLDECGESGVPESRTYEVVDTIRLELEAFADAIEGRGSYTVTPADALHGAAVLEAILESADRSGQWIDVAWSSLEREGTP